MFSDLPKLVEIEPTMNKGFAQIVRTLTRIGLRIELITNGTPRCRSGNPTGTPRRR